MHRPSRPIEDHLPGPRLRRKGMVVLTVLVALIVMGTFLSLGLRLLVTQRAHLRRESVSIQGTVLADSALQRAKLRLNEDPQFSGETWEIPKEKLEGGGVVEIRISPIPEQADQRRISISATCPNDSSGIRIEKSVLFTVTVPRPEGEQ